MQESYPDETLGTISIIKHRHNSEIWQVHFQTTAIKYHNKTSCNLFVGGGSCLQFVKNATSVKRSKVRGSKTRYVCSSAYGKM